MQNQSYSPSIQISAMCQWTVQPQAWLTYCLISYFALAKKLNGTSAKIVWE